MLIDYLHTSLKQIAERLGLAPVKQLALAPGIKAIYRISCYAISGHARHSVATLQAQTTEAPALKVVYEGLFNHKPFQYAISPMVYDRWLLALAQLSFDKLDHQQGLAYCQRSIWLVEKGINTFYHSVLLSPELLSPPYSTLINAIDAYLPEAIREIAR